MLLKDLPADARPREKLLARGPAALSDAELLALLLRTGLPGKNALQMGQELLDSFGGVAGLLHTGPEALKCIKGLELGSRPHEIFAVMFLNSQNRLIALEEMFRGTLTQTSVYPREVVIRALALNAASVVLAHNHPSGAAEPSRADEMLTHTLKTALALVDVRVLDHFVVTTSQSVSMAERGLL